MACSNTRTLDELKSLSNKFSLHTLNEVLRKYKEQKCQIDIATLNFSKCNFYKAWNIRQLYILNTDIMLISYFFLSKCFLTHLHNSQYP